LRDAINAGRVPGPRILASARKLITRGEYVQNLNAALAESILNQEFLLIDGPESARQAVRQNVFQNVDVIKVSADENLTVPELAAAAEEAHRNHLKLAVHAIDKTAIQTAIDSGADSIEHGNETTDEQLKQMRDKGIFFDLTPTGYDHFLLRIMEPSVIVSPARRSARAIADARSVTTSAAEMLGWQDKIGAIEPGKFADLIAVTGDPVTDITELERVGFVMKNGEVVRNDFASH
jgi:imidazolonepropionase-like amidohydrolase